MKIINKAIVYKAALPRLDLMVEHLAELPFEPLGETFVSRAGFIPNGITGELVTPIEGGFTFTLRYDEKILPKSSVNAAVAEAIRQIEEEHGRELDKDEAGAVKERVLGELIKTALVKTTVVNAFYHEAEQFLIVPASKAIAAVLTSSLVKVVGSMTTQTIHIADIKNGLTTRLRNHLDGFEDAFSGFKLGESVLLKHKANKLSVDLDNLDLAKQGLAEALAGEMQVERIELVHGTMSFKLNKDFQFQAIDYFGELSEDEEAEREEADRVMVWRIEAAIQLLQLSAAIKALCDLLSYKEPEIVEATGTKAEGE